MAKKKRTADLKRLIKDYKKAKADHHAKEKARRQASARTLALRVQIASLFQESGMNVYRAVYLAQKDERTGRTNLQRLAFGKNLDVTPIVANAAQSDTGSADVSSDCPECEEASQDLTDDPNYPGEGAWTCDCYETDGGTMTVIEGVPDDGPEEE